MLHEFNFCFRKLTISFLFSNLIYFFSSVAVVLGSLRVNKELNCECCKFVSI